MPGFIHSITSMGLEYIDSDFISLFDQNQNLEHCTAHNVEGDSESQAGDHCRRSSLCLYLGTTANFPGNRTTTAKRARLGGNILTGQPYLIDVVP